MSDSILTSTKKILGLQEEYEVFDQDVIMHINTAFSTLEQLGVGPAGGFEIEDKIPTWSTFTKDDPRLNSVKTYIYLRVRLLFDPPATSFAINSLQEQLNQIEWRLQVQCDPPLANIPT